MWSPPQFVEHDPAVIDAMIEAARLGVLVTHGPEGLVATHLPFLWEPGRPAKLVGHMARANPHRSLSGDGEALVILPGPEAYVSPNWYPSKAIDSKQVPTWNYEAVHLYGRLGWFDDADGLLDVVSRLSEKHESAQPRPWTVADAPADYVERLLNGIVGVRLTVSRIEAKRKLGQNKPDADRLGVIEGLAMSPDPRDRLVANAMQPKD
jgi:transcriptional regulator